jgi:hypothetical protein
MLDELDRRLMQTKERLTDTERECEQVDQQRREFIEKA